MNTSSNTYTVIYASVMVVIVAFLLAFTSMALKPMSDKNEAVDKKKQILASLNIRDLANEQVEAKYKEVVLADETVDANGNVVKDGKSENKDEAGFTIAKKDLSNGTELPVYVCEIEGVKKYVLPVVGKGLWGGLWGYVALDEDMKTVYGAYFSHESETAGLGALIAEVPFQQQFQGKRLFNEKGDIALSVVKKGKTVEGVGPENQCDAVTGATLTSNGVNDMLHQSLSKYKEFLNKK